MQPPRCKRSPEPFQLLRCRENNVSCRANGEEEALGFGTEEEDYTAEQCYGQEGKIRKSDGTVGDKKEGYLFNGEECTPFNSAQPRVSGEFCSPLLKVSVDNHAFPEPRTSALGQDEPC